MGDSLDGSGEPSPESQNVAVVEFTAFANYLRKAVTVLLPDEDVIPLAFNMALEERYNQDCIRKFLGDSQVSSLYVQRSSIKGERNYIRIKETSYRRRSVRAILLPPSAPPLLLDAYDLDNRATIELYSKRTRAHILKVNRIFTLINYAFHVKYDSFAVDIDMHINITDYQTRHSFVAYDSHFILLALHLYGSTYFK